MYTLKEYANPAFITEEILSPNTRSRDMVDRLNTYMVSGVKDFWIVDPVQEVILVYGFKERDIDHFMIYRKQDTVRSFWFPDLDIIGANVFP